MSDNPNESDRPSPEPMDEDAFQKAFLLAFQQGAARSGLTIVKWQDDTVECRDQDGETSTLGLQNLSRTCRQRDRADWPDVIDHFLHNVSGSGENELPEDLDAVADQVLPRIGPPLGAHDAELKIWWKKLDPERVWLNLVVDYPTRMAYVTREMAKRSGQSGDAWLERALANLRAMSSPEMVPVVNEEIGLRVIAAGDSYDAARIQILDKLLPETEQAGCFVAPIGREQVLILPVAIDALPHIHILKLIARDNYPSAPYAISDEVFWVRRGEWHLFPIEIEEKAITVHPPEELVEVLNLLAGDGEGEYLSEEN